MRYSATLLACTLLSCSSNPTSPDANRQPVEAPLGSAADKNKLLPATAAPPPASAASASSASNRIAWPAAFATAASCPQVAARGATIRMRPAANAATFGQLHAGDHVQLVARTGTGWVGFSPGSAQAGNSGIFRLRWVLAAEAFAPGAACGSLPLVAAPPDGCLLMAGQPLPVRQQPAANSTLLGAIPAGSYARVAPGTGTASQWVEVVVPGRAAHGFVAAADASFTGPCH